MVSETGRIELAPKQDYVDRSVISTPTEIVKYMVELMLSKLCIGKTPQEVLQLRLADISCGSGVFLEEVFSYLQQYCVNWYEEHDKSHLCEIASGRYKLSLAEKKELLTNCIFGIDMDVHAVEVAKFSLLLKLLEDETSPSVSDIQPILPNLDANILLGNSLIGPEEIGTRKLSQSDEHGIVVFDWMEINGGDKFDAIIGNPPYVNTEQMHHLLPKTEFSLYSKCYVSAYKQFDKYYLFIERALKRIKESGFVCYIVPNKFFKIASGEKLRGMIASGEYLVSLDDFGDKQLFEDRTIYSSILLLQNERNDSFDYSRIASVEQLWGSGQKNTGAIKSSSIDEKPWCLSTDTVFMRKFKALLNVSVPITKHVHIFNGIQTSAEKPVPVYWFSEDEIVEQTEHSIKIKRNGQFFEIEKALLRAYFKPTKLDERGLNTFSLLHSHKLIIFPYDSDGRLICEGEFKSQYPGAWNYLLSNYKRLVPRSLSPNGVRDVPNATEKTWYQYGRTQALTAFINTKKLIVGILSKNPMYAYDDSDMLIASGGTAGYCAICTKENTPYALEYIQAWLTNSITERIIRIMGSDFSNGFIARGTALLERLPFVELDLSKPTHLHIYTETVENMREIRRINYQLEASNSKKSAVILTRKKEGLIAAVEKLIKSVYDLEFDSGAELP